MNKQFPKKNLSSLQRPITIVSIGIIALSLLGITGCTEKSKTSEASSPEAVIKRIEPIGKVNVAPASEATTTEAEVPAAAEEAPQEAPEAPAQASEEAPPDENQQNNHLAHGKAIVESNCVPCHNGNLPGAPVISNPADWTPRLSQGKETLVQHVINGYNAMPPKGGNPNLSEEDITAAVAYIISQVSP